MTVEEFSNEFDVLIDSYKRFKALDSKEELDSLDFDEYAKSLCLTQAQENIIIQLYNGKNPFGDSFEKTEEIRRYLNSLVATKVASKFKENPIEVSKHSYFYELPEDVWFITYESVDFTPDDSLGNKNIYNIMVVPVAQDDFHRIKNNPFRGPSARRVLRLDVENGVELISKYSIDSYKLRYVKKPEPIVLVDLPNDLTINGINKKTECMLDPSIHRTILNEAVRLAITSKGLSAKSN